MADEILDPHKQYEQSNSLPFDPHDIARRSPRALIEDEQERISWLPEFQDVFQDRFLLYEANEFFGGDLWTNVLSYVEARNEFRALNMPGRVPAGPDDKRYAAEFFMLTDPEHATWDEIYAVFCQRMFYKHLLANVN